MRAAMYTLFADAGTIYCAFPYDWLPDFKALLAPDERHWDKQARAWRITHTGFDKLCRYRADCLAPLPLDVLFAEGY